MCITLTYTNLWFIMQCVLILSRAVLKSVSSYVFIVTAGPDSWLVRPSDTTEGDFSIFFYCNTAVQRFKIHKSGHQYSMGGRYFDRSVSAVSILIGCFKF